MGRKGEIGAGHNPPRAATPEFWKGQSGGPRAGCAVRKWVWCACPAFAVACGVAQHARGPEYRRMVSASDRRSRAACWLPGHGRPQRLVAFSDTGLAFALTMRERQARRVSAMPFPVSARRPATGPFPPPPRLPAGAGRHKGQDFSGGWLQAPVRTSREGPKADPAASGTRRCTASSIVPPHVTAARKAFLPPGPERLTIHPAAGVG
jgi:hypothetical protein